MNFEAVPPILSAVAALLLGGLVGSRGPRRVANLTFAGGMMSLGATELAHVMLLALGPTPARAIWAQVAVGAEVAMMLAWAAFSVTFAAADAMSQLRRWRWPLGLATAASLALLVMAGWQPFVRFLHPDPFGGRVLILTSLGKGAVILSLVVAVFVLFHLESTLRNSAGVARWTIKYFMLGLLGVFGIHIFVLSHGLLYGALSVDHFAAQAAICLLSLVLVGFYVVRRRLLEVEVFISRHVVYRSVAIGAVGAYLLGLGLTSELLKRLGVSLDLFLSALLIFVTAMALMVGLLSETVRRQVRRAIATHFYRDNYDYRKEWTEFTRKLTSVVSLEGTLPRIVETVMGTMGLQRVAIFLAEESGILWPAEAVGLPGPAPRIQADAALMGLLPEQREPLDLSEIDRDHPLASAVAPLRSLGLVALVPLVAKSEVVGLLAVGPGPDGKPFSYEDQDLLTTMAAQATTAILNARLAEQLARTRELEALHRVSSFALHDLKNLVATLSLVTQNAAERGNDPTFQRDAFQAIEGSVSQMRELIARLSDLPKTLDLRLQPTDVNDLIHTTVEQMKPIVNGQIRLVEELGPVPAVLADPEHLQKALYNLVLNAVEAITETGEVRVRTTARNGSVLLEVADTGHGIPEVLLSHGLFTPLRSTKRRGLGIGLYQVKTIVEAHGGRISVESRQGCGSTFSVDLPVAGRVGVPRES